MTKNKWKRGQAVRLIDGVDHRLAGEIGVVLGTARDGGTREKPAKPYVVVGWGRGAAVGGSAYAANQLVEA